MNHQHKNAIGLIDWLGQSRPEVAFAVIRRRQIGGASNDLGFFATETGSVEVIVSQFDSAPGSNAEGILNTLKQNYAEIEVTRQARLKGYSVKKVAGSDNVVRLQLVKI